jgi:uncharacterized protein YdhG (YjbR/CyaY superfamily)
VKREPLGRDVDEYLAAVPEPARSNLAQLRKDIKAAAPNATEVISYQIPTFRYHGPLAAFAAFKNHCSLYVISTSIMEALKDELKPYTKAKTTIRFPIDEPLPAALVTKIVHMRMKENEAAHPRLS